MDSKFKILLEKLIAGDRLSASEIQLLKQLFIDPSHQANFDQWLSDRWTATASDDVPVSFTQLKQKVDRYEKSRQNETGKIRTLVGRFSRYYQQAAAVLLLPLILGGIYWATINRSTENRYTASAPMGQKAKVELPDGSLVWLNSGSEISYTSNYNVDTREINLKGEAYFDVAKNKNKPFYVHTQMVDVEVTGTKFNLNAYNDESVTETALVEGHVNLYFKNQNGKKYELNPGNVVAYSNEKRTITTSVLNPESAIGWKDDRLIFVNDDFYKLARKIERWYNMEVIYEAKDFEKNKLTVKLLQGEQLSKLLQIIESAIGAHCTVDGTKIYITKK